MRQANLRAPETDVTNPPSAAFVGDIPGYYDRNLGPILFEDYALDIAARAARARPVNVLELAAGTGIVSRKLRDALPPSASLMVTDLNPPMLDIAKQKFKAGEKVGFATADAAASPYEDDAFDLIVCQFGYMFLRDKRAGFREARRVLSSGGLLLFSTWAPMAANPFSEVAYDVGAHFAPAKPPMFYRVPFSYGDQTLARADLAACGFKGVSCDAVKHDRKISDWAAFARGAVYGNPLLAEMQALGVDPDNVVAALLDAFRARFGREPTTMPLEALMFSARKS